MGGTFVAGHRGMVGSALVRRLVAAGVEPLCVERAALDLCRQEAVEAWMSANRPDIVYVAAAKVGGILANANAPADFLHDNLAIQTNLIHAAHQAGVERLVFLGSSCIYPKLAPQPIAEESLLTGPLEPTNEAYAIAKIAGVKLAAAYRRQHGRRLHLDHADATSTAPTTISIPRPAMSAGADPQVQRGEGEARAERHHLGHGRAAARVSARRRSRARRAVLRAKL